MSLVKEERQAIILVVEDDEVCSRLAIRQLAHLGFTAHSCTNGSEAVEQLSRGSYSLILMDLQMPVMGGLEATKAIRQLEKKTRQHIPIIGVTANPDRDLCLKAGMDDFVFKPASLAELTDVLNRWLPDKDSILKNIQGIGYRLEL
jgi:CheY-like chemotaxis protein